MPAGELAAGVNVHRQPLAGVEQLDEQSRIGTELGEMLRSEKSRGLGTHEIAQQSAVRQAAHSLVLAVERRAGGADPVLRRVIVTRLEPAECGDRRTTAIEAMQLISLERIGFTARSPR